MYSEELIHTLTDILTRRDIFPVSTSFAVEQVLSELYDAGWIVTYRVK